MLFQILSFVLQIIPNKSVHYEHVKTDECCRFHFRFTSNQNSLHSNDRLLMNKDNMRLIQFETTSWLVLALLKLARGIHEYGIHEYCDPFTSNQIRRRYQMSLVKSRSIHPHPFTALKLRLNQTEGWNVSWIKQLSICLSCSLRFERIGLWMISNDAV